MNEFRLPPIVVVDGRLRITLRKNGFTFDGNSLEIELEPQEQPQDQPRRGRPPKETAAD